MERKKGFDDKTEGKAVLPSEQIKNFA